MKVFTNGRVPIKSWCNNPEAGAIEQATNLANLPFIFKWLALMPDTHQGYGMPIGGVLATNGVVIPNAVGSDIGCGMSFIESDIKEWGREDLIEILKTIRATIPVGFNKHKVKKTSDSIPSIESQFSNGENLPIIRKEFDNALFSVGTLGGGNHFIELQKNESGNLCVMIHSGSRNLGKKVADHYNKLAEELNSKYFSSVPKEYDLAFLPLDSSEAQEYISEMNYCVNFALANRMQMIFECRMAICEAFQNKVEKVNFSNFINIPHNYARLENHFGENVMVHRKGATSAKLNELGLIPGSQGSSSYVVRGKGNVNSFSSCSHGAGRKLGRKEAQRTLNIEEEKNRLEKLGVIHAIRSVDDLDEAAGSYKDIDVVMEEQKDLIEIVQKLQPLAVVKG